MHPSVKPPSEQGDDPPVEFWPAKMLSSLPYFPLPSEVACKKFAELILSADGPMSNEEAALQLAKNLDGDGKKYFPSLSLTFELTEPTLININT